jgi:Xaa-Pro aminopeptidase
MDFGAVHAGYHGDLTRVVSIGPPTGRFHEVYDLVLQAQHRVLENTRPGMTGHQLDALARDFFKERNLGDHFRHGTGHGVGLAIHEPPRLREGFDDPIEPGMVITIEPGLYFDDWGGVRIEDMVIVTDDGIENITPATKEIRTINL